MHITELKEKLNDLPKFRPHYQRWIFLMNESPAYKPDYSMYNNFFNLTSTYTRDSNFPGSYENYARLKWETNKDFDINQLDFHANKTKFAAAIISNCRATNGRLNYIKKLKKYIQLDLFGKCGQVCPGNSRQECKKIIAKEYKFYLAFENSNCRDYITEKFFYTISLNIIPIVYGEGDYKQYVKSFSFFFFIKTIFKSVSYISYKYRYQSPVLLILKISNQPRIYQCI